MQIKLTIEYDGSNYSGWQLQSGQDSIQEKIEAALARIFSQTVRIRGSGRTDAGVHALGQVAAFTLPRAFAAEDLNRALNGLLPPDIVVVKSETALDSFDPRRHALSRRYEYRILNRQWASPFEYRYCWHLRDSLDFDRMNDAARRFVGEHDFAAFRTLGSEEKSTVRRIYSSEWRRDGNRLLYRVEASSFLRHMVRTMVATMVEVGRAKAAAECVTQLIDALDRTMAPAAAPARGLFLTEVHY